MTPDTSLDKIFIKDFLLRVCIGVDEVERATPIDVLVNIVMWTDTHKAAQTNDLADAVNYSFIHAQILSFLTFRPFILIENFAQELASLALQHPLVQKVHVTVEKPLIFTDVKSAGIEIIREK